MAMTDRALDEAHRGLRAAGIDFVSGLPDGWQRPLHERVEADSEIRYVPVGNEGVGFSVCAGAWLGGKKPALIMENSGLRVACEYIARISLGTGVPAVGPNATMIRAPGEGTWSVPWTSPSAPARCSP